MRRPPIRIRTFILGTVLVLLLMPTLAGGAAWLIEGDHQQSGTQQRLNAALAYLGSHRTEIREPVILRGFARLLDRLDLLGQLVIITEEPPGKDLLYVSPALNLNPILRKQQARQAKVRQSSAGAAADAAGASTSWTDDHRLIAVPSSKALDSRRATLVADLYYPPPSRATRALVALSSGIIVLLVGLAATVWLAGRWMVAPLAGLSAQVDKVAGGDLTIAESPAAESARSQTSPRPSRA